MTISDAAKELGISRGTIYRMIEDGRLRVEAYPYLKHGRARVLAESVARLKRMRHDAAEEPPRAET